LKFLLEPKKADGTPFQTADFEVIMQQFLGYLNKANVTIVDLSGIPFEVLSITVSLVSRLIFDFCFHYSKLGMRATRLTMSGDDCLRGSPQLHPTNEMLHIARLENLSNESPKKDGNMPQFNGGEPAAFRVSETILHNATTLSHCDSQTTPTKHTCVVCFPITRMESQTSFQT